MKTTNAMDMNSTRVGARTWYSGLWGLLLGVGMLLIPDGARAVSLGFGGVPRVTIRYVAWQGVSGWWYFKLYVDPESVYEFQLDADFDEVRGEFLGFDYVAPYVQTTAPDLGELASGFVRDVAGISSVDPAPPGEVNLFLLDFRVRDCGSNPEPFRFVIFASPNDFVIGQDTLTGDLNLHPAASILPAELSVTIPGCTCISDSHDPSLESLALASVLAAGWVVRRRNAGVPGCGHPGGQRSTR